MGRARSGIGRKGFDTLLGAHRGDLATQEIVAGENTPAALAKIAHLKAAIARGRADESLAVLRACGVARLGDPLLSPLIEGVISSARDLALGDDWMSAAQAFCHHTKLLRTHSRCIVISDDNILHIWPAGAERVTNDCESETIDFACGVSISISRAFGGPPYPVRRALRGVWARTAALDAQQTQRYGVTRCPQCITFAQDWPDCSEHRDFRDRSLLWEAFNRREYERTLDTAIREETTFRFLQLREQADIEDLVVVNAVQTTLLTSLTSLLMSPAGEDVLHRALNDTHYQRYLASAREHGLPGVYAFLNDRAALEDATRYMLPSAAGNGIYLSEDDSERFSIESYHHSVISGLDELTESKNSAAAFELAR
jgi:hypothetical protein